jgi:hypothetical protein
MDRRTDGQTNGWIGDQTETQMDKRTDRLTSRPEDEQADRQFYGRTVGSSSLTQKYLT